MKTLIKLLPFFFLMNTLNISSYCQLANPFAVLKSEKVISQELSFRDYQIRMSNKPFSVVSSNRNILYNSIPDMPIASYNYSSQKLNTLTTNFQDNWPYATGIVLFGMITGYVLKDEWGVSTGKAILRGGKYGIYAAGFYVIVTTLYYAYEALSNI